MESFKQMVGQMAGRSSPRINRWKTAMLCIDLVNDGSDDNGFFKKALNFDISLMKEIELKVMSLINRCKARGMPVIGVQAIYDFDYIYPAMRERFEAMGMKGGLAPKGAWGSEIIPKVLGAGLDLVLVKSHYSAFSPGRTFGYMPGNREVEEYMKLQACEDPKLKAEGRKTMLEYFNEAQAQILTEGIDDRLKEGCVVSLDNYLRGKGIDTLIITGASTHVCVDSTVAAASERGYRMFTPIDAVAAEGMPMEGFARHHVYLSNHGMFKSELTTTEKVLDAIENG